MNLIINTEYGQVEGVATDHMRIWKGIPYAAPPIGELRYKRAHLCKPWTGVRAAKDYGNRPVQFTANGVTKSNCLESEDCLVYSVYGINQIMPQK